MRQPPKTATFVDQQLVRKRRRLRPLTFLLALLLVAFLFLIMIVISFGISALRGGAESFRDDRQHFLHGSIGSETATGLPYEVWQALPALFPETFGEHGDYRAFGFLYAEDEKGRSDLPIGISRRTRMGITQVWLNCAVCHTGTWRADEAASPQIVAGMPSNNLDLHGFTDFLIGVAHSPKLAPGPLMAAIEETGGDLGWIDRLLWRAVVFPRVREALIQTNAAMRPLLDRQPHWGPGRVDTFNPYKVLNFGMAGSELSVEEVVGASDFPSIWLHGPREGMQLHWDGNNPSLKERNLSAALGAGVTAETVDHERLNRVASWLRDLTPPPSPHRPDAAAVARGAAVYASECEACHGRQGAEGYEMTGAYLGKVEPWEDIGTDRARLDSYTQDFQQRQVTELFAGTEHAFREFRKTDGYANMPLDGLWLRGPYLHNGSVPTLYDLLNAPEERPVTFSRASDVVDGAKGGFVSPPCTEAAGGFCYDTRLPGNSNAGHVYGTGLSAAEKADLLAYLLTF